MFVCEDEALLDEAVTVFMATRITRENAGAVCSRIERNGYADIRYFPQGEKVLVDDVNSLVEDVYYTPVELEKKFYVINKAQTANEASQNKLLKTLEDTPSSCCIILKCTNSTPILPTIKSRCIKVEIPPYPLEVIEKELAKVYREDDRFYFALGVSRGYAGIAYSAYADEKAFSLFTLAKETLIYMKSSKELLHYSALWLERKQNIGQLLDYLELILADLVLYGARDGQKIRFKGNVKEYVSLEKAGYTGEVALKILPVILQAKQKLDFNANVTAVIDGTLYSILEVKTKCLK